MFENISTNVSVNDQSFLTLPRLTWGISLSVMSLTGTLLNLYVITLSCISHRYNRRPLSLLILSQSVADLVLSLWLVYEVCWLIMPLDELLEGTALGHVLCQIRILHIVLYYTLIVSNWSHLITAYNRYCLCNEVQ